MEHYAGEGAHGLTGTFYSESARYANCNGFRILGVTDGDGVVGDGANAGLSAWDELAAGALPAQQPKTSSNHGRKWAAIGVAVIETESSIFGKLVILLGIASVARKRGEGGIRSVRLEACGDGGVEDVHYVSWGVVDGDGVSIVCPDRESCVADCDRVDVVAEVRSDVDGPSAPVGGNS